ncbi:MAG: hypothetical protein A3D92_20350 [Bacteroidetes bacterium RIFCSPHIGHO2_02_FULL_44_7]|nr:MAG: hypothetical protein A3D92_20350 [Bacteroidetes bacterium RIFCSPHIGHO2_02_FULL_44_7]
MSDTRHTACLICESTDLHALKGYEETALQRCGSCSMVFASKVADENMLRAFYGSGYNRTNYLSPITIQRYHELLDLFEPFRKTNKLLDVGAGCGFFLEVAKEKGWEVYGTEFSDDIVAHCREKGLDIRQGSLEQVGYDADMFDVVICIEVIEHLVDPKRTAQEMHRIVRSGGCVYLTTPNFNALLRYRLKSRYNIISFPLHLSYFTSKTIGKMFGDAGFTTDRIWTTGYSKTRLRTSTGKSNQDYVSETSDDEMIRYRIERNRSLRILKNVTNGLLNLFKVGDSLKARFIKK